jgi:hypothetical protein
MNALRWIRRLWDDWRWSKAPVLETTRYLLVDSVADISRPTRDELEAGLDMTEEIAALHGWTVPPRFSYDEETRMTWTTDPQIEFCGQPQEIIKRRGELTHVIRVVPDEPLAVWRGRFTSFAFAADLDQMVANMRVDSCSDRAVWPS